MTRLTRIAHQISIGLMAAGVLVATGVGFAQSWAGLHGWALDHDLTGWKAASFPAMVDLFILIGELGLFAVTLEGHRLTRQGMSWVDLLLPGSIATAGWGVSLAFNVGHVDHEVADQVTAAVPPIASMLGLLVLLRTLHRLVTRPVDRTVADVDQVPGRTVAEVADDEWPVVDRPDGEVAEVDGYALWELVPATVPDGWPITYGQTADRPNDHPAEGGGDDDQDDDEVDDETDGDGHRIGHRPDGPAAGQAPSADLESAMRSARARGRSVRSIAKEFGVSRHRASKLTADVPATVNGHRLTG